MAKIIDKDSLNVSTEITIDTSGRTFTLVKTGNLSDDGVKLQALYSKFVDLWTTSTYNKFPFPMYVIDPKSGQYQFGTDGSTFSGWKPYNDTTRQLLRDGGWEEFAADGDTTRKYLGVITLGSVGSSDQLYYQKESSGSPIDFTYTGPVNEGVQVFGDIDNGDFDNTTYFKIFARIQGKTYSEASLTDIGETETGPWRLVFNVSSQEDFKITHSDGQIELAPYTSVDITYYGVNQNRSINGVNYPFRIIIDGAGLTAEQIYEKVQYSLRQNSDIDAGAGSVIGQTAASLLVFNDVNLYTTTGVYIDNFDVNDTNRLFFTDQNGIERQHPYLVNGTLSFNSTLTTGGAGIYRMYFYTLTGAGNDWGESGAVTVQDNDDVDIAGTISGATIPFTFDYENNNQGGRTPDTDAEIIVVAINPGYAKEVTATYTIEKTTGQNISLVAEQDRAYLA